MEQEIIKVLNILEDNGYEAYIVGGYVRDKLMGINSTDIDIATNAKPNEVSNIFNKFNYNKSEYGIYKINYNEYTFDIMTYRSEISYDNRRPVEYNYTNNLEEDVIRRDFTINTICMNKDGEIKDILNGINDLNNKIIKSVGDPYLKLKEDPLRILRALRFAITLNFTIEKNLMDAIKRNMDLITNLSYTRKKEELDKILISSKAIYGLNKLKELGILKLLEVTYDDIIYVPNIMGMYAQLNINDNYPFTKEEKYTIESIKKIIKNKKITNELLFQYGLYINQIAGNILNIDNKEITIMYENLPIKDIKELEISGNEIITVLNIKQGDIIKKIQNILIGLILNGKLNNNKDDLVCYIINNKRLWLNE